MTDQKAAALKTLARLTGLSNAAEAKAKAAIDRRDAQALKAFNRGATYVEIAEQMGTSKHRITQVLRKERAKVNADPYDQGPHTRAGQGKA